MEVSLPLERIAKVTNARAAARIETIQSLWSGYGQIVRVELQRGSGSDSDPTKVNSAIVKHVDPPDSRDHKYGWSGDVSHQRKLLSYENEARWYRNASQQCSDACRVPQLIGADASGSEARPNWLLVLEDLDASGFHLRRGSVNDAQLDACLDWLANFHAAFLFDSAEANVVLPVERFQLWPIGTYWHLKTRPDELAVMEAGPLKQAAAKIDATLNEARFQTLVHGDAKLANFCFATDDRVAAVDFQYVGGGCGMKDVAYLISSCFSDTECEAREQELLGSYFGRLKQALAARSDLDPDLFAAIETEWRAMYPIAWADFYRFLAGWSPGHWKMHGYSKRVAESVVESLA